ncbi:hypothetical protein ACIQRE_27585 [Streptomyces griseoluteus]|uniref:hypothetical protein n=1 Tax=Streptomyces griseoluteus TaxID=29306 RepID=UPI0038306A6B
MSATRVRRPTEGAAIARTARRPAYSLAAVLADMTTANRLDDREGLRLLACRAVRATSPEVGE